MGEAWEQGYNSSSSKSLREKLCTTYLVNCEYTNKCWWKVENANHHTNGKPRHIDLAKDCHRIVPERDNQVNTVIMDYRRYFATIIAIPENFYRNYKCANFN